MMKTLCFLKDTIFSEYVLNSQTPNSRTYLIEFESNSNLHYELATIANLFDANRKFEYGESMQVRLELEFAESY